MSAGAVLDAIRAAGGSVYVEGAGLRIVPRAVLTGDLRGRVLAHKPDIIAALAGEASERWLVARDDEVALVATVPAWTLDEMMAARPGACVRPLSAAAWDLYGEGATEAI
jgi:hypothetical protein